MSQTQKIYTAAQQHAIEATRHSMAVIAGAGSGKTSVLVDRIARLYQSSQKTDHVLAITFTEKAAGEIRARLEEKLAPDLQLLLCDAWIGTFHHFCARILRLYGSRVGVGSEFNLLDESAAQLDSYRFLENQLLLFLQEPSPPLHVLLDEMDFVRALELLHKLFQFRWQAKHTLQQQQSETEHEVKVHQALCETFELLCAKYDQKCIHDQTLHFQDLELLTHQLLQQNPELCHKLQQQFHHILVDEFQDTNDVQNELIKMLFSPPQNHLFVVGDPRQSIYRFRGANLNCFLSMMQHITSHGGELVTLQENFRSQEKLIHFINQACQNLKEQLLHNPHFALSTQNLELQPGRESQDAPAVLQLPFPCGTNSLQRRKNEANAIARYIQNEIARGRKAQDIAILFRAMSQTHLYVEELKKLGIPYHVQAQNDFFMEPIIQDFIALLSFAADIEQEVQAFWLAHSPWLNLSDDELLHIRDQGKTFYQALLQHQRCAEFFQMIHTLKEQLPPSEFLVEICKRTSIQAEQQDLVDRFLSFVCSLEQTGKSFPHVVKDLLFFIAQNIRLQVPNFSDDHESAVQLMTIHASKGLEFPIVIIPDVERGKSGNNADFFCFVHEHGLAFKQRSKKTPLAGLESPAPFTQLKKLHKTLEDEEAQRLLYVALTRAEDTLVFPLPDPLPEKCSELLEQLLPAITQHAEETVQPEELPAKPQQQYIRELVVVSPERLRILQSYHKKAQQV